MKFTKMHGLGNDFCVVAEFSTVPDNVAELAQRVCNRNFGVGADGMVFILPSEIADFQMRIFNSDGSEPEQCGNAVRCVGKYVYDNGLTQKEEITLQTLAGIQRIRLFIEAGKVQKVTVDMGEPTLVAEQIPTALTGDRVIQQPISVPEGDFAFTAVSMGNPHAVIFVDSLQNVDLHAAGPQIETHGLFPRKTNVEFVEVHSPQEVTMHVWERGCGETLACGTGACAVAVASALNEHTGREVLIHLKGGDLHIHWNEADNRVYMTGPSVAVYEGQLLF